VIIWGQVTAALVSHENVQRSHLVSVNEDIPARVKVENALAASNASLERFAYSASHDLQEPLRKISAFSGMLMERLKGKLTDRDAIYQLDRISDSSRRMGEMIQSLLELSRYSRIDLVKESIKLSELMAQVREDLAPKISHSKTMIELKNDAVIFVEKNSFQQVLRNLIVNSILYSKKDITCHITVSVESVKNKTEVHVSDNGVGFSADYADQIFEPFRRLVPMDRSGTGMGLAICKQIMKSHNGDIYAKSTTDGAEFTIILPSEVNL
jgi:light-regulated signal transduction histidine kinase (bacteriophytochrome)